MIPLLKYGHKLRLATHDKPIIIWLATQEGLARFDGVRFTVFDKRSVEQIKENVIEALYEDHDGALWIGTEGGGLIQMKQGRFTAYTTAEGLPNNIIDAIYEDHENNLWIGTPDGLTRFKDGEFKSYTIADGLVNNTVLAICEDRQGSLWIGTGGGLNRLQGKKLIVTRQGFVNGASMIVNGVPQATVNDSQNPNSRLISKKAGKKIKPSDSVMIQVQNPNGSLSNEYRFTRSAN